MSSHRCLVAYGAPHRTPGIRGLAELPARLRAFGGEFPRLHAFRLFDHTCRAAHVLPGLAKAVPH